jgi:hypothetical protein
MYKILAIVMWLALCLVDTYAQETSDRGLKLVLVNEQGRQEETVLYQKSYALLIGVSQYTAGWPILSGVEQDVSDVETALTKQGFAVTVVKNPNAQGLREVFGNFINSNCLEYETGYAAFTVSYSNLDACVKTQILLAANAAK